MKLLMSVVGLWKMTRKRRESVEGVTSSRVLRLTSVKGKHIVRARERTSANHMEQLVRVTTIKAD